MAGLPVLMPPENRGQGDFASDPGAMTAADVRMSERAMRERWPIRPEMRQTIIDTLTILACNPLRFDARTSVLAARALLAADKMNMEQEKTQPQGPEEIQVAPGVYRWDFSTMSDEELDAFINARK